MTRVLVVDSLQSFLQSQAIPASIHVDSFSEAGGIGAGECAGLIPVVTTRVGAREMDALHGLRVIANYGVGYDNIDVVAAHERGIAVSNTPGVLTDATAQLTWALILAVARRIGEAERLVRAGAWQGWQPTQLRGMSLKGKTLGIVGAGRIGREVARRAHVFGMRVLYWDRVGEPEFEEEVAAQFRKLPQLLAESDVVSIHLSKSAGTEGLIDASTLARLRDGAIIINTARGAIVDEQALIRELQSGRIAAGLDVYAAEPHVPEALLRLENVVLLPHIGSATFEARQAMWDLAWQNLLRGVAGQPLLTPVPI